MGEKRRLPSDETLIRIINSDPGAKELFARFVWLEWDTKRICNWLRETKDREGVTLAEYAENRNFDHIMKSTF